MTPREEETIRFAANQERDWPTIHRTAGIPLATVAMGEIDRLRAEVDALRAAGDAMADALRNDTAPWGAEAARQIHRVLAAWSAARGTAAGPTSGAGDGTEAAHARHDPEPPP